MFTQKDVGLLQPLLWIAMLGGLAVFAVNGGGDILVPIAVVVGGVFVAISLLHFARAAVSGATPSLVRAIAFGVLGSSIALVPHLLRVLGHA